MESYFNKKTTRKGSLKVTNWKTRWHWDIQNIPLHRIVGRFKN